MNCNIILLLRLAGLLHASPVRQDCGKTKSFTATNECGEEYGNTWIECASGITAMPTFTATPCDIAAQLTTDSLITTLPTLSTTITAEAATASSTCDIGQMICIDWLYWCNGDQLSWGDCFDPCLREMATGPCSSITSGTVLLPPNTLPPTFPTDGPTPTSSTSTRAALNPSKVPQREDEPWCKDKPYMCAPAGW